MIKLINPKMQEVITLDRVDLEEYLMKYSKKEEMTGKDFRYDVDRWILWLQENTNKIFSRRYKNQASEIRSMKGRNSDIR